MCFNKKSVSPIIATLLLVTVSVIIGVSMYDWYKGYTENISQDINDKGFSKEIRVDYINRNTLYAYNEHNRIQFQKLIIDGIECEIVNLDKNFFRGTIEINFSEICTDNLESNINEIVIVTDKGTYSSILSISDVNYYQQ